MSESKIAATSACGMTLDFGQEPEVSQWITVLDGVMGGRSTGVRFAEEAHMVFRGTINTNGGGFSSVRRGMRGGDMAGADALRLKLRQDGRQYKLSFRTDQRFRGRAISYQINIPKTQPGAWAEVTVPLENFQTSVFGFDVPAAPFDAARVREMGIILADGVDGPFRLDIAELSCAPAAKAT